MPKTIDLKSIDIYGVASCIGAQNVGCDAAPRLLQSLDVTQVLAQQNLNAKWVKTIAVDQPALASVDKYNIIAEVCTQLAQQVAYSIKQSHWFLTIGGDHSCAIGTWSGAATALVAQGDIGLVWIDAHMDAHTAETSPSGAIHGMPVASLLGYGARELTGIASTHVKIKAENICLIGVRSYEPAELELLNRLGVKVYMIDEVRQRGLHVVFNEAINLVKQNTCAYGISLDMDAIDPQDAPGVGSPEINGIKAKELLAVFAAMNLDHSFLGFELTELNTVEDIDAKTTNLALDIIQAVFTNGQCYGNY